MKIKINPKIEMSKWYLEQTKTQQIKPRLNYNKEYLDNTGAISWNNNPIYKNIEYSNNYSNFINASKNPMPFIDRNPQTPKMNLNPNIKYQAYAY